MNDLILTTPERLKELIAECLLDAKPVVQQSQESKQIRGIHGLAKFLGISSVTAQRIKNSGQIPYSQYGRVIIFDTDKVLEALRNNPGRVTGKLKSKASEMANALKKQP